MVTDTPGIAPGWKEIIEPRPSVHPRLAAKVAKCLPWMYAHTDTVIWADAACRFTHENTVSWLLEASRDDPLTQFIHPWRSNIFDEAKASIGMPKYDNQPMDAQVQHYMRMGHPVDFGLWATGLIIYHIHDSWSEQEGLHEVGSDWLAEQVRWSVQDQLSQPYVLHKHALRPAVLPGPLHGNGYVEWMAHRDAY